MNTMSRLSEIISSDSARRDAVNHGESEPRALLIEELAQVHGGEKAATKISPKEQHKINQAELVGAALDGNAQEVARIGATVAIDERHFREEAARTLEYDLAGGTGSGGATGINGQSLYE